jgi:hypothetical protein
MLGGGVIYAAEKKSDMREELIKYFKELDDTINSRFTTLSEKFQEVISENNVSELESFFERHFYRNTNAFYHMKKYVSNG